MNRNVSMARKARDVAAVLVTLAAAPAKWRRRLRRISVPALLDEVEADARRDGPLSLSPGTLAYLVNRRTMLTLTWRRTRCLLSGLLLLYLLARTGRQVALHFDCRLAGDDKLAGHCWIQYPGMDGARRFLPPSGRDALYVKTVRVADQEPRARVRSEASVRPNRRHPDQA